VSLTTGEAHAAALARLGRRLIEAARELAIATVEDGLRDEQVPSLARLGRPGQLGAVPAFVAELGRALVEGDEAPLGDGTALAARAREHARKRGALGFEPREIVTELLILRRVLWRFVSTHAGALDAEHVLEIERRLNDTIDRLITECVVEYVDRATADLSFRAHHDALTELLNHRAFTQHLEGELTRAQRYGRGVALVFLDLDDFKDVNDTHGHLAGDRVLRRVAMVLREILRSSDVAGRMGGDEFCVLLLESDLEAGGRFLARLGERLDREIALGNLPPGFSISAGSAHFPGEGADAETLFRVADARLYAVKRR
jgi:diguanylate cyclase (GGDEF)-like protein